ncbi:hypothetical protein FGB62_248g08 [Gracilaria domingensis]|nr:hypothetical protein FGB62_248g08 [Gracilaria domingensis]
MSMTLAWEQGMNGRQTISLGGRTRRVEVDYRSACVAGTHAQGTFHMHQYAPRRHGLRKRRGIESTHGGDEKRVRREERREHARIPRHGDAVLLLIHVGREQQPRRWRVQLRRALLFNLIERQFSGFGRVKGCGP